MSSDWLRPVTWGGWRAGFPDRGRGSADVSWLGGGLYKGWLALWLSFGSGLLTGCWWAGLVITWTLWQCFEYSDCNSAADSYTFTDCNALTLQKLARIGIWSHDVSGSLQMNMDSLGVMDLDLSISPDVRPLGFRRRQFNRSDADRIHSLRTPADAAGRQVGNQWRIWLLRRLGGRLIFRRRTLQRYASAGRRMCSELWVVGRWTWNASRRDARKRSDRAFRHIGPGYCIVCDERVYTDLDAHMIGLSSGAGSAVAMPCGVEGVSSCLRRTFDGETWGLDILCH